MNSQYFFIGTLVLLILFLSLRSSPSAIISTSQVGGGWMPIPEEEDRKVYIGGSTRCFSCEKDLMNRGEHPYKGRPTLCFDCESQATSQLGPNGAQFGQPSSCFSCENGPNPYRRPSSNHRSTRPGFDESVFDDQLEDSEVGFGPAGGLNRHEGECQNPTNYQL